MLLWLIFAALTAAVVLALTASAGTPEAGPDDGASKPATVEPPELAIYRGQIAEIAVEREQGLIGPAEAEAARAEVGRRLLAAAAANEKAAAAANDRAAAAAGDRVAAAPAVPASRPRLASSLILSRILFIAVPLASVGLYAVLGRPGMPSHPAAAVAVGTSGAGAAGKAADAAPVEALVAKVEAHLREKPEDGEGWDVIAPVYLSLQRYPQAAQAFGNALRLQGETAKRLDGFAKATILGSDGIVSESARTALEKLTALKPSDPEPQYWLAVAKEQDGRSGEAVAMYRAMLAAAPAGAPWRHAVEVRIAALTGAPLLAPAPGQQSAGVPSSAPAAPAGAPVPAALQGLPPEQAKMIGAMVEGLAGRLAADPRDLPGWQRLIKSYSVLGRVAEAKAALATARATFKDDTAALDELAAMAGSLGIKS